MAENKLKRDLYMYDDFDKAPGERLVKELIEINEADKKALRENKNPELKPIRLHINSYGGSVSALLGILSAIDSIIAPVITIVEGAAYSCGSLLSVAGDYRMMGSGAKLLIHPPSNAARGESSYLEDETINLKETEEWSVGHYAKHSHISKSDLKESFKTHKQWYIRAEEALELGLIDEIIPERSFIFDRKNKEFSRTINGEELVFKM